MRASSRRPHVLLQQGIPARWNHEGHSNPAGGTYDRDANGELTGRVTDRANAAFNKVGKRESFTPEQRVAD